ncbi:tetraspanin-4-like [Petromyzon marinus]|uniref:Tetraspanin n=1 Tax=Petromyzon marinus TaxID=7757 RepID=A0AAJ7XH63_PETMA|nr:tetraspanin-4-like [Petromyzon marinus]
MGRACHYCLKYLLFVFNLVFWLGGCGVLGVGIWLSITQGGVAAVSPNLPLLSAANLLIALGAAAMLLGFLGCLGAIKENPCLLLTFFVLLLVVFLAEFVGGVLFFVYQGKIEDWAQDDLRQGLHLYGTEGNVGLTNAWNTLHSEVGCCGVHNHTDWFAVFGERRVPDSCCRDPASGCGSVPSSAYARPGCYEKLKSWIKDNLAYVGIFCLGIATIQILGMVFSMTMFCHLRAEEKDYE